MLKVKGKVVSMHTMNAYRGHRGISPPIINHDTRSWISNLFMPKGQSLSLWTGLQVSCGKITSDLPDCLNYCVIFVVCTECTNVAVGHIIQPGRQLVGEPCTIWWLVFHFTSWLPCSWGMRPQYPLNGRLGGLQSWSGP
jgi:hypothetical protein